MGALLSLPLLAVPSMSTVSLRCLPRPLVRPPDCSSRNGMLILLLFHSVSQLEARAAELQHALLSAVHAGSFKTGRLALRDYGCLGSGGGEIPKLTVI